VVAAWGTEGIDPSNLYFPTGISTDDDGGVWVSDTKNNRIQYFENPFSEAD